VAYISDPSFHVVGSMDQGPLVCTVNRARDDGHVHLFSCLLKKFAYALLRARWRRGIVLDWNDLLLFHAHRAVSRLRGVCSMPRHL